jgi:hypothetical protein
MLWTHKKATVKRKTYKTKETMNKAIEQGRTRIHWDVAGLRPK